MNENIKKKLPIGIESFDKIRTEDFYYIDKTGLIKELLYNWGEVNLFTRSRRFGKSLNMSMLKSFFEISTDKEYKIICLKGWIFQMKEIYVRHIWENFRLFQSV